jgi:hypothetical protein
MFQAVAGVVPWIQMWHSFSDVAARAGETTRAALILAFGCYMKK